MCTVGPRVQFSGVCVNRAVDDQPAHRYSRRPSVISGSSSDWYWVSLDTVLANGHRLKMTPSNPLCLPKNLILKQKSDLEVTSSCRMRVINHNWSATKQRIHLQSVAEISRHSVLSGDIVWVYKLHFCH